MAAYLFTENSSGLRRLSASRTMSVTATIIAVWIAFLIGFVAGAAWKWMFQGDDWEA